MKKLISFIFALCATTMAMAQNQGSFVVADKDGNSFLVRSLIFQRDETEQNYSWSTEGFENRYQKSLDISKLQFIARINEEIATASADEVTEMLEELSGTDEGDAEVIAASLQNNPNVEEAYTEDGVNLVVKSNDDEGCVIYPMYEMTPPFSELEEPEELAKQSPNLMPRKEDYYGRVAIFNFFEGMSGYEVQNIIMKNVTNDFAFHGYIVENYNLKNGLFTYEQVGDVLMKSSKYAAIIIITHGAMLDDGKSYFCTGELGQVGEKRLHNPADDKYYKCFPTDIQAESNCILYLGSCFSMPVNYVTRLSPTLGYPGVTSMAQANAAMIFHLMLNENYTLLEAINSLPQEPALDMKNKVHQSSNVRNQRFEGADFAYNKYKAGCGVQHYSVRSEYYKNKCYHYLGGVFYGDKIPLVCTFRLYPILSSWTGYQNSYNKWYDSSGGYVENNHVSELMVIDDLPEGIYKIMIRGGFPYEGVGFVKPNSYQFALYSKNFKEAGADMVPAEADYTPPTIVGSSEEITLPAGSTKTFTIDGYSGHTFRTVSLEPEIADVTINGNTLTVKAGVEGETYIGVVDEQNRKMAVAEVKVTAGQAFDGQIVMERRYLVNNVNNYCYQESSFRMDNGIQLQIRYYNTEYWESTYDKSHHGIFIAVGPCTDVNQDWYEEGHDYFDEWYIAPVVTDEWVDEKIVISDNGDVQYFMNGENMGTHHFDMLTMDNAQSVTVDFWPYGWWTGQIHYMDDLNLTLPNKTISDNFNDGVIDTSIWQTPDNPDGVREEDGIMKLEQVKTDWPFHIRTNPIPLTDHPVAQNGCPDSNHPHMIDLGLPSGTKWACCNVGASAPEEYGGYYAWGETEEKDYYNWENYLHCDGSPETCHDIGSGISGTQYDVAHVKWGYSWTMPTLTQIEELLDKCASEWTQLNGVNGRKFTNPNGISVFLPAAGILWLDNLDDEGNHGCYWSGTRYSGDRGSACVLGLRSGYASWGSRIIDHGLSVRPVAK